MRNTPEQDAIVAAVKAKESLIIYARAGAGKTATLIAANKQHRVPTLTIAFNKAIADDVQSRTPAHVTAKTMHSLCYGAFARYSSSKIFVKKNKVYANLSEVMKTYNKEDFDALRKSFKHLMRHIRLGKQNGWVPESAPGVQKPLVSDEDYFNSLDHELSPLEREVIQKTAIKDWEQTMKGTVDFDDQILVSAIISGIRFSHLEYDCVMVDEAQDLSPIMHKILKKVVGRRQLVAVGDPYQAIYAFRGADTDSMSKMQELFSLRPLYLTTTFRCATSIVEEARSRAEDIQAASWAKPGKVSHWTSWKLQEIPNDCAIICRNNAPLFSLAIRLIRARRRVEVKGSDVIQQLTDILRTFGKPNLSQENALVALEGWWQAEKKKSREKGTTSDRYECMKVFLSENPDLGSTLKMMSNIIEQQGPIKLMTGHKSKGLEFPTVIFLSPSLIRPDEGQDLNIRYVIQTRAEEHLIYAELSDQREDETLD